MADELKQFFMDVLEGTALEWSTDEHYVPDKLVKMISGIEGVEEGDLDTNGWQWDWWKKFEYKGKKYTLSGSGYYGGHGFGLADEE